MKRRSRETAERRPPAEASRRQFLTTIVAGAAYSACTETPHKMGRGPAGVDMPADRFVVSCLDERSAELHGEGTLGEEWRTIVARRRAADPCGRRWRRCPGTGPPSRGSC